MTITQELLDAAECYRNSGGFGCSFPEDVADKLHLLASFAADQLDAEPATVEWIEAEFPQLCDDSASPYQRRYEPCGGVRIVAHACPGGFKPCELWTGSGDRFNFKARPITRGEVRRLVGVLRGAI